MSTSTKNATSGKNGVSMGPPEVGTPLIPAYLTAEEAAVYLQVGRSTIYELISSGEVPSVRLGKRIVRIKKTDLDNLVSAS